MNRNSAYILEKLNTGLQLAKKARQQHVPTFKKLEALSVAALFLFTIVAVTIPARAAPIGGKRAAVLSPFTTGASWGLSGASHDPAGVSSGYGFAWDLRAGASAEIYPRIVAGDGTLSLSIPSGGIGDNPSSSGKYVKIDVKVDGVLVGKVKYIHLVEVPSTLTAGTVTAGTLLGKTAPNTPIGNCVGFACSNYWGVSTVNGIHTHVDFSQACYGSFTDNGSANESTGLVLLSANYGTTNKSACDTAELAAVASGGSTGTVTNGRPAVISRSSGSMDVFYRTPSGGLVNVGWDSTTGWGSTRVLASSGVSGNPSAVARSSDSMDVFYRDTSNNLQNVGWTAAGDWGSPTPRVSNGTLKGDPLVLSRASGYMDVFYRDTSNRLMDQRWNATTGWSASPLAIITQSTVAGSPAGAVLDSTHFHVLYRDTNNSMQDVSYSAGSWAGPLTIINGTAAGGISAVSRNSGRLDVFYATTSGTLGDAYLNMPSSWGYTTWSGADLMESSASGATYVGAPSGVRRDSNNISVFYQDSQQHLVEKGWNATTNWSAPHNRGNNVGGNPAAVSRSSGNMDIFYRDYSDGGLGNAGWDVSNGWTQTNRGGNLAQAPLPRRYA